MKKVRHFIEYMLVGLILYIVRGVPYKWAIWIGGRLTGFCWRIGIRRDVSRRNFDIIMGDGYSKAERDKILCQSYINFGRSMAEFAILAPLSECCLRTIVNMDRAKVLFELNDKKQGAILVTGHLGSWELLGASMVAHGLPIDFLVGEQSNRKIDEMINEERRKMGVGIISMGIAVRGIIKALRHGHMVAMLSDQDGGKAGVEVQMCGHKVLTPGGPAAFALKTNVPIVTGICVRNDDIYSHRLEADILKTPELTGDNKEDVIIVTQAYTDTITKYIKENPTMWFWPHKRFKHSIDYKKTT